MLIELKKATYVQSFESEDNEMNFPSTRKRSAKRIVRTSSRVQYGYKVQ